MVKEFCRKISKYNLVRLVVYDEKELLPLRLTILRNNVYCPNFSELDNKLTRVTISDIFSKSSIDKIASFFGYSLCNKNIINNFIFSNDLNSLESCIKKDLEFLSEIYKKLEKNYL